MQSLHVNSPKFFCRQTRVYFLSVALLVGGSCANVFAQEAVSAASSLPLDLRANVGYQFDDNVTRAGAKQDQLSDQTIRFDLSKRLAFALNPHTRALLAFNLGGEKSHNFAGLSRITGGVQGTLQYRSSAAFDAPTFALFGQVAADQFQSDLRDGYRYSLGLSVQQALTDRIGVFAAVAHNQRDADNPVFNNREGSARLNLDYQINSAHTIYLDVEFRRGDNVTTTSPSTENAQIATDLVRNDDAYPGRQLTSYRFDGKTALTTLGYNLGISAQSSLDFAWRRIRTTPDLRGSLITVPSTYIANQYSLVLLVRF